MVLKSAIVPNQGSAWSLCRCGWNHHCLGVYLASKLWQRWQSSSQPGNIFMCAFDASTVVLSAVCDLLV